MKVAVFLSVCFLLPVLGIYIEELRTGLEAARLTEVREEAYGKEMSWYRNGNQFLH